MKKKEFIKRFVSRIIEVAGTCFKDGSSIVDYALEVAENYWNSKDGREDGPSQCADDDMDYWGE